MKSYFIVLILILKSSLAFSQEENLGPTSFDFWIGNWEVSWIGPDSTLIHGSNKIIQIADGKVIQENFEDPNTGFKGTSISVFNPNSKTWHQAWADNQGSYYDFIGIEVNNQPAFSTDQTLKKIQRMLFKSISENEFIWDWETSLDSGESFQLSWRINYKRIKP